MSKAIAIIPAREGSKSIPRKNFTALAGRSPMNRAIDVCNACVRQGVIDDFYITSDINWAMNTRGLSDAAGFQIGHWIHRPPELAQDDTPMIDVVRHVLEQIPGDPMQPILLCQPTQPLRTPAHLRQALELLTPKVDSVVSVVELPQTHSPELVCGIHEGALEPWLAGFTRFSDEGSFEWEDVPTRRQAARPAYIRDGTVYAFWRKTLTRQRLVESSESVALDGFHVPRLRMQDVPAAHLYGRVCKPLIIPPDETCALDTPLDWVEAERRLMERHA